ncbi:MAG: hypothetical protein QOF38_3065, partial [Pseudonocardiales bacterium]|nr:hypothetical protein [Pseudonocardiales bacterium]
MAVLMAELSGSFRLAGWRPPSGGRGLAGWRPPSGSRLPSAAVRL